MGWGGGASRLAQRSHRRPEGHPCLPATCERRDPRTRFSRGLSSSKRGRDVPGAHRCCTDRTQTAPPPPPQLLGHGPPTPVQGHHGNTRPEAEGQGLRVCHPHRGEGWEFSSTRHPTSLPPPVSTLPSGAPRAPAPLHQQPALVHSGFLSQGSPWYLLPVCPSAPTSPGYFLLLPRSRRSCPAPKSWPVIDTQGSPGLLPHPVCGYDVSPHACPLSQKSTGSMGQCRPRAPAGGEPVSGLRAQPLSYHSSGS